MKPVRPTTRDAILEAAMLVFTEDPSSSLGEVAKRAGVGRATLHRHFRSRADLVDALSLRALDETDAATASLDEAPDARTALLEMFRAVIPLGSQYGFLRAERDSKNPDLRRRYQRQLDGVREMVEALKLDGDIARDVPTAWVVELIDSLIWAGWSVMERGSSTRDEAAALALRTVLDGLGDDSRPKSHAERPAARTSE